MPKGSGSELVKYTTAITRDIRKALKIQAAKEERSAAAVVQQAIEEYLAKHAKGT